MALCGREPAGSIVSEEWNRLGETFAGTGLGSITSCQGLFLCFAVEGLALPFAGEPAICTLLECLTRHRGSPLYADVVEDDWPPSFTKLGLDTKNCRYAAAAARPSGLSFSMAVTTSCASFRGLAGASSGTKVTRSSRVQLNTLHKAASVCMLGWLVPDSSLAIVIGCRPISSARRTCVRPCYLRISRILYTVFMGITPFCIYIIMLS